MADGDDEEKLLRSVALQNANSVLLARRRAEDALRRKSEELAHSLALMRATLEATTDGILVTDESGGVTGFNATFTQMWRLPSVVLDVSAHRQVLEFIAQQLGDPARFLATLQEIAFASPPESFHVLNCTDGRVIERHSRVQHVEGRAVGRVWSFRDVTERRRVERELREQQEWFKVTLSSIGDSVITTDTEARVTYLNPIAEAMTGWTVEEARGQPLEKVFHIVNEVSRQPAANPVRRVLSDGLIVGLANHTSLIARDGTEIAIEDSAAPIKNAAGKIIGAVMVFHDVTEQRKAEHALRRSEKHLADFFENAAVGLHWVGPDGRILRTNRTELNLLGYSEEEYVGRHISEFHADSEVIADILEKLGKGEGVDNREARLRCKDGSIKHVLISSNVLSEGGKIVHTRCFTRDVTELKRATNALREEYTAIEHLNAVARTLATELDLGKIVQIVTDAATAATRAQFGAFFYNRTDETGSSYLLYALSGVPREAFEKFPMPRATAMFGPTFRGEGVIRLDDVRQDPRFGQSAPHHGMPAGHLPVVSYLAVPVIARGGEVLGGLFFGHAEAGVFKERDERIVVALAAQAAAAMDIARLYRAEQQARAAAERANKTKDDFLAALSHELRTPLTPVLAILSSVGEDYAIPAALAADLETVRRNVELETRLIDDLLDLTRIARGKLELHWERTTIGGMIENAINTCLPDLKAKPLTLVRDLEAPGQIVLADSARITQVLWNLLKNAIKFTPAGGTITVRSRRSPAGVAEEIVIAIADTGIGIEPGQLERVFDAFEQGGRKITQQFGGLGLGLAISKAIVESHRGSIAAASGGPGQGSTFTVTLPCEARAGANPAVAPIHQLPPQSKLLAKSAAIAFRPLRILLVEDHGDTGAILVRLLHRSGHEVIHATTIAGAVETADREMRTAGLDLVISDLGLPDGSGLDLMRKLSTEYGLRGIALSGFGMDLDREQSRAAGFTRHLTKPIDIAALRKVIAEVTQGP